MHAGEGSPMPIRRCSSMALPPSFDEWKAPGRPQCHLMTPRRARECRTASARKMLMRRIVPCWGTSRAGHKDRRPPEAPCPLYIPTGSPAPAGQHAYRHPLRA